MMFRFVNLFRKENTNPSNLSKKGTKELVSFMEAYHAFNRTLAKDDSHTAGVSLLIKGLAASKRYPDIEKLLRALREYRNQAAHLRKIEHLGKPPMAELQAAKTWVKAHRKEVDALLICGQRAYEEEETRERELAKSKGDGNYKK